MVHHRPAQSAALFAGMAAMALAVATPASAHILPWREGLSRITGYGSCAKGPCLKRYDFRASMNHVHVVRAGREVVLLCTGLSRKPGECMSRAAVTH